MSPFSAPPTPLNVLTDLALLEDQAVAAMQIGDDLASVAIWHRVIEMEPRHARAHTQLGQFNFRKGEFAAARHHFLKVTEIDGSEPRQWVNVALVAQRLKDEEAEASALFNALAVDPYDLLALLMRGGLYERQGRMHDAANAYGAAATVAPALDQLQPDLQNVVRHAHQFKDQYQLRLGAFVDEFLAPHIKDQGGASLARFQHSVDLILGRKRRFDSQPMQYFFPGLLPTDFFNRDQFPWLDAVEAGTTDIRDEFMAVLQTDSPAFVPYIHYSNDQPVAQWAELNHSQQWTALHLVKDGLVVSANADRCPKTMELWSQVPSPRQAGRTPVALFSLLKPKTRIPPHVGVSNARLLVHLPLIVPPGCGFRVGNTQREWVPGKAWVFDDSIEHEAWNDSDALRVVLIFDIWHPDLKREEQIMITALSAALNAFSAERI